MHISIFLITGTSPGVIVGIYYFLLPLSVLCPFFSTPLLFVVISPHQLAYSFFQKILILRISDSENIQFHHRSLTFTTCDQSIKKQPRDFPQIQIYSFVLLSGSIILKGLKNLKWSGDRLKFQVTVTIILSPCRNIPLLCSKPSN